MVRRLLRYVCMFFLVMGLASPVFAQYAVDFNVPLYGQEQENWSGPASAQMVMNGYPDPGDCIYLDQGTIWYIILTNNLPGEPYTWDTDPYGLQQALMILNPPPAGIWSLMTDTVREDLMFDILYWMNRQEYPTPTLVYEGVRWVVIKGFETDIEPVYGSDPVLRTITINDPFPTGMGATSTMAGTVWYDNYWNGPVNAPGTWFGQYVAIVEPPEALGAVSAEMVLRSGNEAAIITPEQALLFGQYWINQLNLDTKDPSYSSLADTELMALDPILVNEEIKPQVVKNENESVCYYLLRYAKGDEFKKGLVKVCVIVNAFTGEFEEVTSFGNPITYLDEQGAVDAASKTLNAEFKTALTTTTTKHKATVVFTPCDFTYLRAYPFWKIEMQDKIVYVEMNGKTYSRLPTVPASYGK